MTIHYFPDGDGFIAVDSTQRVHQAPGFLFGRCADPAGDLSTIIERIWSPTDLKDEVPEANVPDDWIEALGFGATLTPTPRAVRPGRAAKPRKDVWEEGPNLLPGKSYLVPLIPLDEYEEWMNRDCEVVPAKRSYMTNLGFPWETSTGAASMTTLVCILFILLFVGVL